MTPALTLWLLLFVADSPPSIHPGPDVLAAVSHPQVVEVDRNPRCREVGIRGPFQVGRLALFVPNRHVDLCHRGPKLSPVPGPIDLDRFVDGQAKTVLMGATGALNLKLERLARRRCDRAEPWSILRPGEILDGDGAGRDGDLGGLQSVPVGDPGSVLGCLLGQLGAGELAADRGDGSRPCLVLGAVIADPVVADPAGTVGAHFDRGCGKSVGEVVPAGGLCGSTADLGPQLVVRRLAEGLGHMFGRLRRQSQRVEDFRRHRGLAIAPAGRQVCHRHRR